MAKQNQSSSKNTDSPQTTKPVVSRRELLRQNQIAEAKRQRNLRLITLGAIVLAIVIVAVVVSVIIGNQKAAKKAATVNSSLAQIVPPNATTNLTGIVVNPGKAAAGVPVLQVHSDYQCGACIKYEAYFGDIFRSLADKGQIVYERHQRTFMDRNLGNDSSTKSAISASCADTVGAYEAYDAEIFKTASEGTEGFSETQLRETFPAKAGISGEKLSDFQKCYDSKATSDFVAGMEKKSGEAGITSTPTFLVNGKQVDFSKANPNEESIMAVIKAAL